ncbi:hypothetical protein [Streptomyces sp. CA2R101]|uniref:hypothetical protein n=1 Tax=Streptomyces sp. CA2R101 TaxID=3120152 RepID=UPI003007F7CC
MSNVASPHDAAASALVDLPGAQEGLRLLEKAQALLREARERPAALDEVRAALQGSLGVPPQSRPDGARKRDDTRDGYSDSRAALEGSQRVRCAGPFARTQCRHQLWRARNTRTT